MKVIVACGETSTASILCGNLLKLGIDCPATQVLSHEAVIAAAGRLDPKASLTILFAGRQFGSTELSLLEQLCSSERGRPRVVAIGPMASANIVLHAIRCGAVDYLDINGDLETELRSLFDRITANPASPADLGRLLALLSPVGGAGASFLAVNLAVAIAQMHEACVLLDLKLRGGDLAALLKCAPRHNLLSLAETNQQFDRAMYEQAVTKHESGVRLMASPELFSGYQRITSQIIQKLVQCARASTAHVVADLEDAEHLEQVQTLAACDQIVMPLRLDFVGLSRAKRYLAHLMRTKSDRVKVTLVANRVGRAKEIPLDRAAEVLERPIDHWLPDDPDTVNTSFNLGVPVVTAAPKSKLAQKITQLAHLLLGHPQPTAASSSAMLRGLAPKAAAYLNGLFSHPVE